MSLAVRVSDLAARVRDKFNELQAEVVKSDSVRSIEVVTQAEYDAMQTAGTLDPDTFYATTA